MGDVVAAMAVGLERLAALGRPLDGSSDLGGRPTNHGLVGIAEDLAAEAATHVGSDDAQLVLGDAQHEGRQDEAQHVRILRRRPERVVACALVVLGRRCPRLHGVGNKPVVNNVELCHVRGFGDGRVDIGLGAYLPVVDEIAGRLGMDLRRIWLKRLREVDVSRQDIVVDLDGLGRVLGLLLAIGHDHGHRVADIAHRIDRHHGMRRGFVRLAVLVLDNPAADQAAYLGIGQVLAGEDRHDTRHLRGICRLDTLDFGMRMRRAQEVSVGGARQRQIVDVAACAGEEALVFLAGDARTDSGWGVHGYTPAAFMAGAAARMALTMLW